MEWSGGIPKTKPPQAQWPQQGSLPFPTSAVHTAIASARPASTQAAEERSGVNDPWLRDCFRFFRGRDEGSGI